MQQLGFIKKFIKYVILGSLVGIFTGIFCGGLLKSLEIVTKFRTNTSWIILLLPFGGAIISYLYFKFGKNSLRGNNLIIENINEESEDVPIRMLPLVFLGTVTTHLFGGSAGREGSGVQMGGAIAAYLSKVFKLDKKERKMILISGVSSGFGSIFGTPLAGTIFGLEMGTLGKVTYEALIPCFFSSFIGNIVVKSFGINHSHHKIHNVLTISFINSIKIIMLAIIFGIISRIFSNLTHELKQKFSKIFKKPIIRTFVGGIIIIFMTYIIGTRKYLGLSIPLLNDAFLEHLKNTDFLLKLIFTTVTLAAGFQGGEVTPLFVIGASLGNVLARFMGMPIPFVSALGLIGVFAGATNAPITSFIVGVELFGSKGIEYMFLICILSYFFSGHSGIYTSQIIGSNKYWSEERGQTLKQNKIKG